MIREIRFAPIISLVLALLVTSGLMPTKAFSTEPLISKNILDNGMTLIVKETEVNDIVGIEFLTRGGMRVEPQDKDGLANFVANLLLKGTNSRSAQELAFETDASGIDIGAGAASDYSELTVVSTTEFFPKALALAADLLMNASFPPVEIEKERAIILQRIASRKDSPFTIAFNLLNETMYGSHPYGKPGLGYENTVGNISRDDIIAFYHDYYVPNNMVVSVVGDVSTATVKEMVLAAFEGFQQKDIPTTPLASAPRSTSSQEIDERGRSQAAVVIIGYLGPPLTDSDSLALRVVDNILNSGMSSRLFVELRDKRGLAYSLGGFYSRRLDTGPFVSYSATNPLNINEVKEGFLREFERLKEEAVSDEELERAKMKVIGEFDLNHERNINQAFYLAYYEMVGVGYGYDKQYAVDINDVGAHDVRRVASKYLVNPTIVIVSP